MSMKIFSTAILILTMVTMTQIRGQGQIIEHDYLSIYLSIYLSSSSSSVYYAWSSTIKTV